MGVLAKRFESVSEYILMLFLATTFAAPGIAHARTVDEALIDIEERWARAAYETTGREKSKVLTTLLKDVREFASGHVSNPEAAAWHGIVAHECARNRCRSNPSKLRREARDALLKAESLDPGELGGLVYANLGALYARKSSVRGIGYMWKAIIVDPDGLDSNYLYAELLIDERRYGEARDVLRKASTTIARPDHLRADRGRRQQAIVLLRKIESRIEKST
jgi:hypothetical protein